MRPRYLKGSYHSYHDYIYYDCYGYYEVSVGADGFMDNDVNRDKAAYTETYI